MRKYAVALAGIIIIVIAGFFAGFGNIGISGITLNEETLADLKNKYPNDDIMVVRMTQWPPSWVRTSYPEGEMTEQVVLEFPFDPMFLKRNEEWDLFGLRVNFVVVAKKNDKTIEYRKDFYKVIKAKRIFIDSVSYGEDVGNLKLRDLTAVGIVKAIIGLFVPAFRYSY